MTPGTLPGLHGAPLRDRDGVPVGTVEDLLVDPLTLRPVWFVVALDDGRRTVVPAAGSRPGVRGPRVAWDADAVRGCPAARPGDGALAHFGVRAAVRDLAPVRGTSAAAAVEGRRASVTG